MTKHRRYSRKKSNRGNRRSSRKMSGGIGTPSNSFDNLSNINSDSQSTVDFEVGELDLSNPNLNVSGNQSVSLENNPNMFLDSVDAGDTTINTQDWSIGQANLPNFDNIEGIPQQEQFDLDDTPEIDLDDTPEIDLSQNTTMETNSSQGGKKRKSNKRKTNKRKMKKSKKTRKHRRTRQRGGGETTSLNTPIEEKMKDYNNYIRLNLQKDV